jgi:hypothetical protein
MNLLLFLGGTCNGSVWREKLIPLLDYEKIPYFNPVVDNWDEEAIEREIFIKSVPTTVELYVISKEISGYFSIAEAVDSSNKKPEKTIFVYLKEGFNDSQIKSLNEIKKVIEENGAYTANSLNEIAYLFKEIKMNLNSQEINKKNFSKKEIHKLDLILDDLEKSLKKSNENLTYEEILDNLGITEYLNKFSLKIEDLSKDYLKIFYNLIKKFVNFPLYKNLNLNNKKDLKFIRNSDNFKSFWEKSFEDILIKLVNRKSRVESIIKDQKDSVIDTSYLIKESKLDKISLFLILGELKNENKIKNFNENIVTIY